MSKLAGLDDALVSADDELVAVFVYTKEYSMFPLGFEFIVSRFRYKLRV